MCAKSLQLCPTLCDPMDHSPPGSSVHGILQARILEWVVCPPLRDLLNPGIESRPLGHPAKAGHLDLHSWGGWEWEDNVSHRESERWRRDWEQDAQDPAQPLPSVPVPRRPLSSQQPLGTVQWVSPDSAAFEAGILPSPEGQQDVLSTPPPGPPVPSHQGGPRPALR